MTSMLPPIRCVVVPPVAAPYRERLFTALAAHPDLELAVVYQSEDQPSWDVSEGWFATAHSYPATHLRARQIARPGRTPIVLPRGLERQLRRHDPDCVVAWEYGPTALRAFAWTRARRRAHVIFSENTPAIDAQLPRPQNAVHRWLAAHAEGAIAASSQARQRLIDLGMEPARAMVALQSADLERIRAARRSAVRGDEPFTIVAVGRLVPDKNFARLIDAFARVAATSAARLQIVGTGFLEAELRAQAAVSGSHIELLGHRSGTEIAALYAHADAFALVSTFEPFGVAVREAAAAGLPIVCSRVAGAAGDVAIEGRNALLVDPTNGREIEGALRSLIEHADLTRGLAAASLEVDRETDGHDVDAWLTAISAAVEQRRQHRAA